MLVRLQFVWLYRWFLCLQFYLAAASPSALALSERPSKSADLVRKEFLPLRTLGRYIVDKEHRRVKWACINWAGSYSETHVVDGLWERHIKNLTRMISSLGFNCVRLPYSVQGYVTNPLVAAEYLTANPELMGMRFIDIFDRVVAALTEEGIMVIVNNHCSNSGWCCNPTQDDGFWYVPGYNETDWMNSLIFFTQRYKSNPLVVAFDIRNELHDNPQGQVSWGDGNLKTDWKAAAERGGNAVLNENPDLLIVVSGMCFETDLRMIMKQPIQLTIPNRVVYQVHDYGFSQIATIFTVAIGGSWTHVEHVMLSFVLVFATIVFLLYRGWTWLGKPLQPHGVLRMTMGFWLCLVFLFLAIVMFILYHFKGARAGCTHYGREAYMPMCYFYLNAALACVILFFWGWYLYSRDEKGSLTSIEDICDRLVGVTETTRTRARYHTPGETYDNVDGPVDGVAFRRRPQRWKTGWGSTQAAWGWTKAPEESAQVEGLTTTPVVHDWDQGLCCCLQVGFCSMVLMVIFTIAAILAALGDSYFALQWVMDWKWGFALQEGYPYTAPVWLGEFGEDTRGRYWMHLMRYVSVRDVDWSYWHLSGVKLQGGEFSTKTGEYIKYEEPRWMPESYAMLDRDFRTVHQPWKLLDLQQIMSSPAGWVPDSYPCDRAVLGNSCGG